MKIGLMSDTHGYLHPEIFNFFKEVDQIWHAGDIGSVEVADSLEAFKPLRAVYGNVDGHELRARYPEHNLFKCEGVKVWITHIGGYPPNYTKDIRERFKKVKPDLFITGHSHILKVMRDMALQLLHMNPGACGKQGWHKVKTLIRFEINAGNIEKVEVIELL